MIKSIITLILFTLFAFSLNATEPTTKSYFSFNKLNENIYSSENEDKILGLGFDMHSTENFNFIIAYEGAVYNEKDNAIFIDPSYKISSYFNHPAISYKLNYKF